jgi:hypothetical protein
MVYPRIALALGDVSRVMAKNKCHPPHASSPEGEQNMPTSDIRQRVFWLVSRA